MKYVFSFISGIGCCFIFLFYFPISKKAIINANDLPQINSYIENLNSGGCGYFVYKLYQRLDTANYEIVSINKGKHICIHDKINGGFIDSYGYRDKLSLQLRIGTEFQVITLDSLIEMLNMPIWNKQFNVKDTAIVNMYVNQL